MSRKRDKSQYRDVRQSAIYQANFTCDATRIQQQEGTISARIKSIPALQL